MYNKKNCISWRGGRVDFCSKSYRYGTYYDGVIKVILSNFTF